MFKRLTLIVLCLASGQAWSHSAQARSPDATPPSQELEEEQSAEVALLARHQPAEPGDQGDDATAYSIPSAECSCYGIGSCWSSWLSAFYADGWIAQGFTGNGDNPPDRFNGPMGFNDRANEYQLNQLYLILGREVDTNPCSWDMGGRVDLLFGTDYFFTEAIGLETRQDGSPKWNSSNGPRGAGAALYGLAMPQVYAEISAPLGNGVNVKMGHFYTTLGYESVMAPENFFYSHSYSKLYGEPFTHTGMLFTYEVSPNLAVHGGLTRGWDTWENPNDTCAGIGGFKWTCPDNSGSIAFALHTGEENRNGNRTAYTLVATRQLTDRVSYTLQHDLGIEQNGAAWGITRKDAIWYSINQYLFYQLNESTSLGLRVEWFRDEDAARIFTAAAANQVRGSNFSEVTLGLNWTPYSFITVRPEVRWDYSDVEVPGLGVGGMYDAFRSHRQFTFGLDFIARY